MIYLTKEKNTKKVKRETMDPVSHFVDMSVGWSVYPLKRQNSKNAATGSVSGLAIDDSIINENKDTNESYKWRILPYFL